MRNFASYLSYLPKRIVIIAAAVAGALLISSSVWAGFGPDRPVKEYNYGTGGFGHVTFNSFIGVPNIGDERDFLRGKIVDGGGLMTDPVNFVKDGDEIRVYMYVHNGAAPSLNESGEGIAKDLKVKVDLPTDANNSQQLTGYISASNAIPQEIFDTLDIAGNDKFTLEYVPGTAVLKTNVLDDAPIPNAEDLFANGVTIGYDAFNGEMPGCFQYAGWVKFTLKVKKVEEPKPVYECKSLEAIFVDRQTRKLSATAEVANGAKVVSYEFDFGDGKTQTVSTDALSAESDLHTYAPGNYQAKVTINFDTNGDNQADASKLCRTEINVSETPIAKCSALTAKVDPNNIFKFSFSTKTEVTENAKAIKYVYDFGDGGELLETTASEVEKTYEDYGTYKAKVTVIFDVDGEQTESICETTVKIEKPETPPELPNTGPEASILGALFGTSALGVGVRSWLDSRSELRGSLLRKKDY